MLSKNEYSDRVKIVSILISLNKTVSAKYVQLLYLFLFNLKSSGTGVMVQQLRTHTASGVYGILFPQTHFTLPLIPRMPATPAWDFDALFWPPCSPEFVLTYTQQHTYICE